MSCETCRGIGITPARHPRLIATVGVMVTLVHCPACTAGKERAEEGILEEVVMNALALAFLPCPLCDDGVTEDGDFCSCPAGRLKAAVSRSATRIRKGPQARGTASAK